MQQGAPFDAENNSLGTPLNFAAFEGNLDGVKWLLSKKANLDRGFQNVTPLAQAILGEKYAVAKYLVQNGASLKPLNDGVYSPLYLIGGKKETPERDEIIQLMISKGAQLTENEKGMEVGKLIDSKKSFKTLCKEATFTL